MKSDTRYSNRRPSARSERPARDMRVQRTQKEQTVQLTVRGMARGAIRMEAEDGTIYLRERKRARSALWRYGSGGTHRPRPRDCRQGADACA